MRIRWMQILIAGAITMLSVIPPGAAQSLTYRQILDRADRPVADHKIAYGPGPAQFGELWLPAARDGGTPATGLPVVVLIHGGCWVSDYPGHELVAFLADALRRRGVAVWNITYRRVALGENVQGGGYPATFLDVAQAVDHLRALAGPYRLDLTRVVASGHSAGGHLALWAAGRAKIPAGSPLKSDTPLRIKAVVALAGLPDLAHAAAVTTHACGVGTVEKLVDAERRGKDAYHDTSPSELLPLGVPQLLISGLYDSIVPPAHGWRYQTRAKGKGENVELLNLDQAGHFELIAPWTAPGQAVVERILGAL
jgi:acetyl esterase/lipase